MRVIVTEHGISVQTKDTDMQITSNTVDWSCRLASHEGVAWAMKRLSEELLKSVQFYRTGEPVDQISIDEYPYGHDGGRESVEDALEIVASFGAGIGGLNDDFARQIILADEVRRLRSVSAPGTQKYDDVLFPFLHLMRRELHANARKGDRPAWLKMSPQDCGLDIYYHVAKLQKASHDRDIAGIKEHAADVANMVLMLVDIHGVLTDQPADDAWVRVDDNVLNSTLLLSEGHFNGPITLERIATWTDEECEAVQDYCAAVHISASDNDDYPVPAKPAVLSQVFPAGGGII